MQFLRLILETLNLCSHPGLQHPLWCHHLFHQCHHTCQNEPCVQDAVRLKCSAVSRRTEYLQELKFEMNTLFSSEKWFKGSRKWFVFLPGDLSGSGGLGSLCWRKEGDIPPMLESWSPSLHQSCLISSRRVFIRALYSETRNFFPSTIHVLFGRGRYLEENDIQ